MTESKPGFVHIRQHAPKQLADRLRVFAVRRETPAKQLVLKAIEEFLDRNGG